MQPGARPPVVAIGRNEGEDLRRCLSSALRQTGLLIYVDSGSSDDSPDLARSLGASVVELDSDAPFTAARARNEGLRLLLLHNPDLAVVQFLDGDCELVDGWLEYAAAELEKRPDLAAVSGRRRERFANLSTFNRLCDLEWDAPDGEAESFGGDALVRVAAFRQVAGFNPALIAGEEPELSLRMRREGWKIVRLPKDMSLHDAKMTRLCQWWQRTLRSGHAYAEGAWMHRFQPELPWIRQSLSIWFYGAALPLTAAYSAWANPSAALILLLYPLLLVRVYRHMRKRSFTPSDAWLYAAFCVLAKFPQLLGQIRFLSGRCMGHPSRLIEYKST